MRRTRERCRGRPHAREGARIRRVARWAHRIREGARIREVARWAHRIRIRAGRRIPVEDRDGRTRPARGPDGREGETPARPAPPPRVPAPWPKAYLGRGRTNHPPVERPPQARATAPRHLSGSPRRCSGGRPPGSSAPPSMRFGYSARTVSRRFVLSETNLPAGSTGSQCGWSVSQGNRRTSFLLYAFCYQPAKSRSPPGLSGQGRRRRWWKTVQKDPTPLIVLPTLSRAGKVGRGENVVPR